MTQRPDGISVIVCTHNGADRLPATLAALLEAARHAPGFCEIVVVDNASVDGSAAAVTAAAVAAPVPVRTVQEPKLGLSHARNAGIGAARGQIVAFTDDDVTVAPDWIAMIAAVFADPAIEAAGGRILPETGRVLPDWMTPDLWFHFALLDLGGQARDLDHPDVWGANIVFRAGCFVRHGGFDPKLGRTGTRLFLGEETEFVARLLAAGERVVYDPRLVVEHRLPAQRLTKAYLRRRMRDLGEQKFQRAAEPWPSILGVPIWTINDVLRITLHLLDPRGASEAARLRWQLRRNESIGVARAGFRRWRAGGVAGGSG